MGAEQAQGRLLCAWRTLGIEETRVLFRKLNQIVFYLLWQENMLVLVCRSKDWSNCESFFRWIRADRVREASSVERKAAGAVIPAVFF